ELLVVHAFDHEQPAFAVGIFVDRLRLVGQGGVDLGDLAGHRAVDVRGRLDRLDNRHGVARLDAVADVRQFHVHQVAQQRLCVVGDTHGDAAVAFGTDPLV